MQAFKALADPTRIAILEHLLKTGRCTCICELTPVVGKDQSVVFRHVKTLEEAGLVNAHKEGRRLECCLKEPERIEKLLELGR